MRGPGRRGLPTPMVFLVNGTIVDLNPEGNTLTVKEDRTYATWTVTVAEDTSIIGAAGGIVPLSDLRIGEKVQIRGESRIEGILKAFEINVVGTDR
jgi:hypothetical protein